MSTDKHVRHIMLGVILRASIAEQIRAMRISRKLTQVQLAKALKTTQSCIARLEDPYGEWMRIETLTAVANYFDVGLLVTFSPWSAFLAMYCQGNPRVPPSFGQELPV
jgi:transcriptional regulator with XRE-family HTH domain